MNEAVSKGFFAGGSILVSVWGKKIFQAHAGFSNLFKGTRIERDTVFDLASLTKPLATATCLMWMVGEGKIGLKERLKDILPDFCGPKGDISLLDLLCHKSGFPAHRPYYEILSLVPASDRRALLRDLLIKEPLEYGPGEKTVYSDLGFMVLRMVIEEVSGMSFNECFRFNVMRRAGLKGLFLFDENNPSPSGIEYAATEDCFFRKKVVSGETHDLNAFFSGGHDGHAGLFGTAEDVNSIIRILADIYRGINEHGICGRSDAEFFFRIHEGYDRPPGFDAPSAEGSSSGKFFSRNSVGHLGYTGTSFWFDLDSGVCVILLTNRVHPTSLNINIRDFRPSIHNVALEVMKKGLV